MPIFKPLAASLLLFSFFMTTYLLPLDATNLWQPDETRYAEISREMVATGNWIVPKLLGVDYFEKPVFGYWLNNISQIIFGETNFGVRFASVFSTAVSALLIFWLGLRMWREPYPALIATLVYISMALVYSIGTYSVLDPILTMWMTAAMTCAYLAIFAETRKSRMWAYAFLGLACGMGVMSKGFLALVLPVIGTLPMAIYAKRLKEFFSIGFIAPLTALLICLPWGVAVAILAPDYWRYFFWEEHIHRFAAEKAQHSAPIWYYLPLLALAVLPWLGFLPSSLGHSWKERKNHPELLFLLCWMLLPFIFFSIARGKLLTYILPCMAPLALMLGHYLMQALTQGKANISGWKNAFKANALINLCLGGIGIIAFLIAVLGLFPTNLFPNQGHLLPLALGGLILLAWIGLNLLSWYWPAKCWILAALTPIMLISIYIIVIPNTLLAQNKQPQTFIQEHQAILQQAKTILANEPGVATGLAWELKRSQIMLYNRHGELNYGILRSADPSKHFISREHFPAWLVHERSQGKVALLLRTSKPEAEVSQTVPKPDASFQTGKHLLFIYNQMPIPEEMRQK